MYSGRYILVSVTGVFGKRIATLGLFFVPENGGDIFLRIISLLPMDYTALYPRR
jgi:hypothetical protein